MTTEPEENDIEVVPIPLPRETIALLARFGREVGRAPTEIAADIIRDVLLDDARAHERKTLN